MSMKKIAMVLVLAGCGGEYAPPAPDDAAPSACFVHNEAGDQAYYACVGGTAGAADCQTCPGYCVVLAVTADRGDLFGSCVSVP